MQPFSVKHTHSIPCICSLNTVSDALVTWKTAANMSGSVLGTLHCFTVVFIAFS